MKTRTKLQFEVMHLTGYLPYINGKVLSWAKVECLNHIGYATKNRVICMDCGEKFSPELVSRKRAVCPHCETKLTIEKSLNRTNKQHRYVGFADTFQEFQLVRYFEVRSTHKAGSPAIYQIREVLQHWILPNGKREVIARNHTCNWNCDCWNGDLEIRNKSLISKYDIYPYKFHPDSTFKPEYTKIGINAELQGATVLEAIRVIPDSPHLETLLKAKQYSLLSLYTENNWGLRSNWSSIKICMRNKYIVKDSKMWIDYLNLLTYFKKDLKNAHYVCPKNLKREHDKLVEKKNIAREKEEAERKRTRQLADEAKFQKLKSSFFGLSFSDKLLEVKVIGSIGEFLEEGTVMHHCVFTNEYYLKPESLILSAQINGERVETVEVSLKDFKVLQSRGKFNKDTEYHDRIIKLVNRNVNKIRKRERQTISA